MLTLLPLSPVDLLFELLLETIDLSEGNATRLIHLEDIHLSLKLFIFFIQEVDLALEFLDGAAALLIHMLHVQLFEVLRGHIQVMEAQDFFVAHSDLFDQRLTVGLFLLEALLQHSQHLAHLVQAVVCLAHFTSPLSALIETILLILHVVDRCKAIVSLLQ